MVDKTCALCAKVFHVKTSHAERAIYCSAACMGEHYKTRMSGAGNPNYRNVKKTCVGCGEMFVCYTKSRRYCSLPCYHSSEEYRSNQAKSIAKATKAIGRRFSLKAYRLRTDRQRTTPKKRDRNLVIRLCEVCGIPFRGNANRTKTCSPACFRNHLSLRQRGAKSHLWQGGKTAISYRIRNSVDYAVWRDVVFQRDDYTCLICKGRGGKLSAHHVKPFAIHPELVFEPSNGATLCWPCHAAIRHREAEFEQFFVDAIADAFTLQREETGKGKETANQGAFPIWRTVDDALEAIGATRRAV